MKKLLALLLIAALLLCAGCNSGDITRPIKGLEIVNESQESSSGVFILGIGGYSSTEESYTYYYTYVKGNEGYRLTKLNAENVEIVETDEIVPAIKGASMYFEPNFKVADYGNYILYVPAGTVFTNYEEGL